MTGLVLLHTPASPFARKVRVVAQIRGVALELRLTPVDPLLRDPDLAQHNPLGRVPVLLTPEGALPDSRIIVRYLDQLRPGPGLASAGGLLPWKIETAEALADGIMEMAVALRQERASRPEALRWDALIEARFARILDSLEALDRMEIAACGHNFGNIALAVALEYLDFRHPDLDWRQRCPMLGQWLGCIAETVAMQSTRP